eukprot:COSAG02_NODE_44747_length_363_cov_0.969697_1_plen_47_part_01
MESYTTATPTNIQYIIVFSSINADGQPETGKQCCKHSPNTVLDRVGV